MENTDFTFSFLSITDVDAPQFLTAPFVHNVTDSGFHITLALDEPGTVLVLVTLSQPNTPLPSVAQVAAAAVQGSSFVASELRAAVGTMTIDQPAVDSTLALEGLEAGREYVVSLVAQDEWQPDAVNRQALAHRLLVTTVADTRAPENLQGFPAVSVVTSSSVTVDLALDEPGRFHIVVVEAGAGAPPPTIATLVTGAAGLTQVVEATGLGVDSAVLTSNLKPDTEYIIYMAATDTQQPPNAQALLTTLAFRTLPADALALPWLASSFPALSGVGDTWLLFEVVTTAPARIVYAVHEAGVGISAGVVSAATVLASPSGTALTKQSKVLYVAVKHLKPSTTYGVHIVVTSPGSDDTVQLHGNSVSLSTTTLGTPTHLVYCFAARAHVVMCTLSFPATQHPRHPRLSQDFLPLQRCLPPQPRLTFASPSRVMCGLLSCRRSRKRRDALQGSHGRQRASLLRLRWLLMQSRGVARCCCLMPVTRSSLWPAACCHRLPTTPGWLRQTCPPHARCKMSPPCCPSKRLLPQVTSPCNHARLGCSSPKHTPSLPCCQPTSRQR